MKTKKITATLLFLFAFTLIMSAQGKKVTGIVTTFEWFPVNQAEISVRETGNKVLTDSLGQFTIFCEPKDKLSIKAAGFIRQKVKVKSFNDTLKIDLKLVEYKKADEIAIGHGHIYSEDVIYARNHLGFENPTSKYNDIFDMIRAKIPGVEIIDNKEIRIRGEKSLTGSNAALIVVDGVIVDMGVLTSISINDIRSIDALKGPDATVYGARGG